MTRAHETEAVTTPDPIGYRGRSWQLTDMIEQAPGFQSMADALLELTAEGHPLVVGTADLKFSNGLIRYEQQHPERFIQFGISEQNMVSAAAGLATTGVVPYVATFASFMSLLATEQMRTDTAYTNLPVRMIGHHAGFALGFYGTSHHATEDIALARSMANMTVLAPADPRQTHALLKASVHVDGPVYIRIGRGREPEVYNEESLGDVEIGKAVIHSIGADITVIATGTMVHPAQEAVALLRGQGLDAGLIDMHTIKPLDVGAIEQAARQSSVILTVEEHNVLGGLGGAVAETVGEWGLPVRVHRHGVNDVYVPIGPPTHLYRHLGLDGPGIAARALRSLGRQN